MTCNCDEFAERQGVPLFLEGRTTRSAFKERGDSFKGVRPMKTCIAAGLLLVGLATPALAAEQHCAVKDTVGNCSVIDARPSATKNSGLTLLGNKDGYDSEAGRPESAKHRVRCKGMVERA